MPRAGSPRDTGRLTAGTSGDSVTPRGTIARNSPLLSEPSTIGSIVPALLQPANRYALILVGHGSHLNADSSAPVCAHAAALRASGVFAEVHEAFWKEEPPLTTVLDLAEAEDVLIVPLFLSEGYFTREVLPREMGLTGPLTRRGRRTFRYLPPVGTHPAMTDMILRRAQAVLGDDAKRRRAATLVVIGHGTERNATSADTVYSMVERLRAAGDFGAVTCGFLDEAPRIGDVLDTIEAPEIVLVPFFVAEGWHTRETIPSELGLTGEMTERGDQIIWYTPPVGTLPDMADVILEIAAEAVAADDEERSHPDGSQSAVMVEPESTATGARSAFFALLRSTEGSIRLMDVVIEPNGDGGYRLRHIDDLTRDIALLTGHVDPEEALEIARFREDGAYRPMRTSADVRRGWVFPSLDEEQLWRALSRLYPAAVNAWHDAVANPRGPTDYRSWAARQTAMYADVRKLTARDVDEVVTTLCATCRRYRIWTNDVGVDVTGGAGPIDPKARSDFERAPGLKSVTVPCLEPCTLFATRARELVARERPVGFDS